MQNYGPLRQLKREDCDWPIGLQPKKATDLASANGARAVSWSRPIGQALFAMATIMCLYLGAAVWAGWADFRGAIQQMSLSTLPMAISLVFLGLGLRACRWHYFTQKLNWPVPVHLNVVAFLAGFAFTATPGKVGEVVKSVLLRTRYGISLTEGLGVLMVERLGDVLAILLLTAGGLALLADGFFFLVIATLLVAAMMVVVGVRSIYGAILGRIGTIPGLRGIVSRILLLFDVAHELLQPLPFLVGITIAIVAWACEGLALHIIIREFGIEASVLTSLCVFGFATLAGALSGLPGGLGSTEVVMVLLLTQLGMPVAVAAVPVVVFRVCTLWLGSLIGVSFMMVWLAFCEEKRADVTRESL
ncbi:lysylphosphatidylglycerol synthase transmembrane domain-containing protein [Mesorhizobium ventifaucium]|uniref:Uncharacterized protein n=1 Tax=Mesorhizobium ventifaucium TaxID=666020 RepID=A0ABM9DG67_9HYPH|nr:lysylphosphatidylglycerol synthase transmembrane domain-containing protein [Mesorhizobium ventifaucium]CAH2395215.1 conserved membrane hypothetical protein [Mesorhizobium ventifaucium]